MTSVFEWKFLGKKTVLKSQWAQINQLQRDTETQHLVQTITHQSVSRRNATPKTKMIEALTSPALDSEQENRTSWKLKVNKPQDVPTPYRKRSSGLFPLTNSEGALKVFTNILTAQKEHQQGPSILQAQLCWNHINGIRTTRAANNAVWRNKTKTKWLFEDVQRVEKKTVWAEASIVKPQKLIHMTFHKDESGV